MSRAVEQLRRLLLLVPQLADGEEHDIDDVAAAIGATPNDLMTDLRALTVRVDAPGGFVEGVQICYDGRQLSLVSKTFLRPMRITPSELSALDLGLAMLQAERPPDERVVITRARERLSRLRTTVADAPDGAMREATFGSHADPAHLTAVRAALHHRRKVRIRYQRANSDSARERVVRPYNLVMSNGRWYLIGWCDERNGVRIFRFDRVTGAWPTDERFEMPAAWSVHDVLDDHRVLHGDAERAMQVWYSPGIARWVAERAGMPVDPDGSLTLEHPVADLSWAVRHVLQYGPDAEVLAPDPVRNEVVRRLRAIVAEVGD